jgi:tetratricopeptide (TPR) repeat protein
MPPQDRSCGGASTRSVATAGQLPESGPSPSPKPSQHRHYLRGEQLLSKFDTQQSLLPAALAAFDQATSLDPNYALAYSQRARVLDYISIFVAKPRERAGLREQAREAAERGVALAPELGETHLELAQVRAYALLDFAAADPEFDRAVALAPGNARVQQAFSGYSSDLGHYGAAVNAARRAISLDPQNVWARNQLAQVFADARHYDEVLLAFHDARMLDPGSHYIEGNTTEALLASGRIEHARQRCESPSTPLDEDGRHSCLALGLPRTGAPNGCASELEKLNALDGDRAAYEYARNYAQWGNTAAALQWLTKAERLRNPSFQKLRVDWALDPIRNEPQFKAIEARMNFPP